MSKVIGVSLGDPSGVGIEVFVKWMIHLLTLEEGKRLVAACKEGELNLRVYGAREIVGKAIAQHKASLVLKDDQIQSPKEGFSFDFVDVPYDNLSQFAWGKTLYESGKNALQTLERVCGDIQKGEVSALVTLPVSKEAIKKVDEHFVGHTEFLSDFFSCPVMMCFFSDVFNLALMTTHVPISGLSELFKKEHFIKEKLEMGLSFQKYSKDTKALLTLGLNPHAGEGGKIGTEDLLFKKIVEEYVSKGEKIEGPLSSDSAFVDVVRGKYKTVLACYHDQGLIPLKMLSKGRSVNFTYGLPFVRTSVDHGTAFDIAGTMRAEEGSFHYAFLRALKLMEENGVDSPH